MNVVEHSKRKLWLREWPLALAVLTLMLALLGKSWVTNALNQPTLVLLLLLIICSVILAAAVATVRHAEILAQRMGEPACYPAAFIYCSLVRI